MRGGNLDEDMSGAGEAPGIESMTSLGDGEELVGGRIKWFDMVKGYGFVTPDQPGGDILVHYNLLARYGRKSLPEGTRVVVVAKESPRGRQASAIVDLDISKATGPDLERAAQNRGNRQDPLDFLDKAGEFEPCEVRWFNRAKGYGFLLRNDGVTQVFIHMETVRRGDFESLLPGQRLEARIHDGPRGALAVVVRPVDEVHH
jgi:CspA family cold shock protein